MKQLLLILLCVLIVTQPQQSTATVIISENPAAAFGPTAFEVNLEVMDQSYYADQRDQEGSIVAQNGLTGSAGDTIFAVATGPDPINPISQGNSVRLEIIPEPYEAFLLNSDKIFSLQPRALKLEISTFAASSSGSIDMTLNRFDNTGNIEETWELPDLVTSGAGGYSGLSITGLDANSRYVITGTTNLVDANLVLTAIVPEPSTLILFALTLVGLFLFWPYLLFENWRDRRLASKGKKLPPSSTA